MFIGSSIEGSISFVVDRTVVDFVMVSVNQRSNSPSVPGQGEHVSNVEGKVEVKKTLAKTNPWKRKKTKS